MSILNQYGWNSFHSQNYNSLQTEQKPGRVISIKGFKYFLMTERGELETELSGKLLYGTESEDIPKVGDWVLYLDYDTMGYIVDVMPRKNMLSRKSPGGKTEKQVLATNIDTAVIVQGLDRDFNVMRLERYLVQMAACGIDAIVVLNKADLVENPLEYVEQVRKLQRDIHIFVCSTYKGVGLDELITTAFQESKTSILIGSSGVGKSSILNKAMNIDLQTIGEVSDVNQKGKHTTTTRDLFRLQNGALIIDTPGMREFGVTYEEGVSEGDLFPAIKTFAAHCKFSDCRHIEEKGCAVLAALEIGELDAAVYDSYIKLLKEQRRFQISAEDKKRMDKQAGRMSREASEYRKKYKN